jgi:hypothetical protein
MFPRQSLKVSPQELGFSGKKWQIQWTDKWEICLVNEWLYLETGQSLLLLTLVRILLCARAVEVHRAK